MKTYCRTTHEAISIGAYFIYKQEGHPEHRERQHWFEAEAQLIGDRKDDAGRFPTTAKANEDFGRLFHNV
ncbi:MAG: hypothetical protein QOD99_1680 [Chthoniobacter sp.]|jgi:hypothetical protein|nr:hypothetical protein [Chthoniobacter sp.]